MPVRPPTHRPKAGRGSEADARERERAFDRRRLAESETRRLYKTERWQRLRAMQLAAQPLCERCLSEGRITPATVCHHAEPHRGDAARFFAGPFASSCAPCHDVFEQREEARARGQ